jgi:hypothetical protein
MLEDPDQPVIDEVKQGLLTNVPTAIAQRLVEIPLEPLEAIEVDWTISQSRHANCNVRTDLSYWPAVRGA